MQQTSAERCSVREIALHLLQRLALVALLSSCWSRLRLLPNLVPRYLIPSLAVGQPSGEVSIRVERSRFGL